MSIADSVRHKSGAVRLRARWVLPIHLPPIKNGEVVIEDGQIISVGRAQGGKDGIDLGLTALLPGFVNVHSHLEYTVMRGLLEDMPFFPWIRRLTALKAHLTLEDWIVSATFGAAEMLAAGITTVGDCADAGASLSALLASGQRGIVFREIFGVESPPTDAEVLSILSNRLVNMRAQIARTGADSLMRVGVSPHAPYTVRGSLLAEVAKFVRRDNLLQAVHLAESPDELAMLRTGTGEFAERWAKLGAKWQAPDVSSVAYAAAHDVFDAPTIAVHCIDVDETDAAILRRKGATVAHCPRSNGKLGNGIAPIAMLRKAGLTIGLGTDSVASNNSVDMFEEMRSAVYQARGRERDPLALRGSDVLAMATRDGATVLRCDQAVGTLTAGKRADLCVVRLDGLHLTPTADDDPVAALVYAARASDVLMTMVDGRVLYEQGNFTLLDVPRLRGSVGAIRARLRNLIEAESRNGHGA